ncbi:recombinase family protein [Candidatus Falkowbacteria bacterium]|nr:recombinase family protein [Candidatus Falkowbacteria bacterium]
MTTQNTIKYFAYVRKSTEGEERQALSIESQKDKVKEIHPDLDIVEVLEEKHSAFKPYNRPVFDDMIRRIRLGEAHGIIAWHPDRLSRNEIDASTITYLVRTNIIHDLKFGSYNFDNSPEGIMMLQLALSQSQYFSSKLGKDVRRGLEKKVSLGWLPGVAPQGYLNDMRLEKGQRTIILDKKRSVLLQKAFNLMLTGNYSARDVLNILNNDWHYTTRKKNKLGGKPLARSSWYKMLSNPFYAGIIVYNGIESKGKHKPLITLDEFNRIQEILGLRGCKRKPKRHNFTYAGMFKCGSCDCGITAERKTKYIKSKNEVKGYNYYHCTHKKKEIDCREGSVEENEITENITGKLKKLEMHPLFLKWSLDYLDTQKGIEKTENKAIEKNKNNKSKDLEAQLSELTMMRARKLIDDDLFTQEKNNLKKEIEGLKKVDEDKNSEDDLIELVKEKFVFSAYGYKNFIEGDKTKKKEILVDLGSNRKINDKKVLISVHKWLLPIYENAEIYNAQMARLEPLKFPLSKRKNEALTSLRLSWLPGWDSNPRPIDYTYPIVS